VIASQLEGLKFLWKSAKIFLIALVKLAGFEKCILKMNIYKRASMENHGPRAKVVSS